MVARRRRVVWTAHARDSLIEALVYIAQDSPSAARQTLDAMLEAASTLEKYSERGRVVPELGDPLIRELLVQPYRLIYRVGPAQVQVLAIVHQARDFIRWPSEEG